MTGNIKALTDDELKFVVERYEFSDMGDSVLVKTGNRHTLHSKDTGFSLLLPIGRRRIKITPKAIGLWLDGYKNKYSLIEVQNAINTLVVTYQSVTAENLSGQLKRTRSKLDNLFKEGA